MHLTLDFKGPVGITPARGIVKMQGVSERIKDSGIWWIRWTGADG